MSSATVNSLVQHLRKLAATDVPDSGLVQLVAAGPDDAAFEALVARHGTMVWNLCRRQLRDEQLAEDVFQATFLTLARRAGAIRKQASVASWLHGVAYRLAVKARGKARRQTAVVKQTFESAADPLEQLSARELCRIVDEELGRLPERNRLPLVLCILEERTQEEAAQQLCCPLGTLRSRLERGRELLRGRLRSRGVTLPAALLATMLADGARGAAPPPLGAGLLRRPAALPARVCDLAGATGRAQARWILGGVLALALAVMAAAFVLSSGVRPEAPDPPPAQGAAVPQPAAPGGPKEPDMKVVTLPPKFLHKFQPKADGLVPLAFSPDGKTLAAGGGYDVVRLFDAATGQELLKLDTKGKTGWVNSIAFHPDGKLLAACGDGKFITVHNAKTGELVHQWSVVKEQAFESLCYASDGKKLGVSSRQVGTQVKRLFLLDERGEVMQSYYFGKDSTTYRICQSAISPDGRFFATPGPVISLDVQGQVGRKLEWLDKPGQTLGSAGNGYCAAFSPDGKLFAAAGGFVPAPEPGAPLTGPPVAAAPVLAVSDWPAGQRIFLKRWQAAGSVTAVAFLVDSKTLASAGPDKFRLWDAPAAKEVFAFPAKGGTWCGLAVDPQGRYVAFSGGGNEVQVWSVAEAKK